MSMGPFKIKFEGGKYLIKNRWGDLIREAWTDQQAHNWVNDWYTTRALEDKFLKTNIHVRLRNYKNRIRLNKIRRQQRGKYVKAQDRLGLHALTLSCGYVCDVQRVA